VLAHLKGIFRNSEVIRGSATALVIKVSAAVTGFAMFALLARHLDPTEFGHLAMLFNGVGFLATVALCGQETLIVRSWDEYKSMNSPELALGVLTFGLKVTSVVSFAIVVVAAAALLVSGWRIPGLLSFGVAAFFLGYTTLQFSGQFARVAAGVVVGEIPRELMWRVLVLVAVIAFDFSDKEFGLDEFFPVAAAATIAAIAFQAWLVFPHIPPAIRRARPQTDLAQWIPRSIKMWLSALLDASGQYLEIILIGLVLGPRLAAFYFALTKITSFFAMVSGGGSIYATSRISSLYYAGNKESLQEMLRALALINGAFVACGLCAIFLAGQLLLAAFGPAYTYTYPALLLLSVGAAVGALAGPSQHLLLLTGHEGVYPRIMAIGLAVRFALIVVLGPIFGLQGVVAAWSFSAVVISLSLIFVCRRRLHLDPSLLSILKKRQGNAAQLKGGVL
jgi:O-antigen/teichoic acid export membrane protein